MTMKTMLFAVVFFTTTAIFGQGVENFFEIAKATKLGAGGVAISNTISNPTPTIELDTIRDTISVKSDTSNVRYGVQLLSTTMNPYPYQENFLYFAYEHQLVVETKVVNGKTYYRHIIDCGTDYKMATEKMIQASLSYKDAFIVIYKDNKRFN